MPTATKAMPRARKAKASGKRPVSAGRRTAAMKRATEAKRRAADTARAVKVAENLSFRSLKGLRDGVKKARLQSGTVAPVLDVLAKTPVPARGQKSSQAALKHRRREQFARAVLTHRKESDPKAEGLARALVGAGRHSGRSSQIDICRSFIKEKQPMNLVHLISELPEKEVGPYLRTFFAGGGTMRNVTDWLLAAGEALNKRPNPHPGTDGLFSKVRDAVDDVAKSASKAVNDAAKAAAKAAEDAAKSAGGALNRAAGSLGDNLNKVFKNVGGVSKALDGLRTWTYYNVRNIVRAALEAGRGLREIADYINKRTIDAVRRIGKVAVAAWEAGVAWGTIFVQTVRDNLEVFKEVVRTAMEAGALLRDVIQGAATVSTQLLRSYVEGLIAIGIAAIDVLKVAAVLLSAVAKLIMEALLRIFGNFRHLTAEEKAIARKVFGSSINLNKVRVAEGSQIANLVDGISLTFGGPGAGAFTFFHIISLRPGQNLTSELLIHELTHTWQGERKGWKYIGQSWHEQIKGGSYNLSQGDIDKAAGSLTSLPVEKQAVCVECYYARRWGKLSTAQNPEQLPDTVCSIEDWKVYHALATQVHSSTQEELLEPVGTIVHTARQGSGLPWKRKSSPVRSASPVILTERGQYWDPVNGRSMTRAEFVRDIRAGRYPAHSVSHGRPTRKRSVSMAIRMGLTRVPSEAWIARLPSNVGIRRHVGSVGKDAYGNITSLHGPWGGTLARDAIRHIKADTYHYYTQGSDNTFSGIHVVNGPYGKYLRTNPNKIGADNLDSLPVRSGFRSPARPAVFTPPPPRQRNTGNRRRPAVCMPAGSARSRLPGPRVY